MRLSELIEELTFYKEIYPGNPEVRIPDSSAGYDESGYPKLSLEIIGISRVSSQNRDWLVINAGD